MTQDKICLHCIKPLHQTDAYYGVHQECFFQIFGKSGPFEGFSRQNLESGPKQKEHPHLSSYFAGNYRKYEARLGDDRYILKFQEDQYPDLVATEYACNCLAKQLHIPISEPFAIIQSEGESAFVVKNFTNALRGPYNLVHLYHYMNDSPNEYTVKNICHIIKDQTNGIRDVEIFLLTTLYDALIGNHDRHGRNLAIVETATSKTLSPIYDNVSALGLESGALLLASWSPKGKIFTQDSTEPEMADYVQEIYKLGYPHVVAKFEKNLRKINSMNLIQAIPLLSKNMKHALIALMTQRTKDFYEAANRF